MVGRKIGIRFPNRIKILAGRAMVYMKNDYVALISPDDVEKIRHLTWHFDAGYAKSSKKCAETGRILKYKMHRLLADAPLGLVVDHKNGDGLDNRRSNIRVVTANENAKNRRSKKNGIEYIPSARGYPPYVAFIRVNTKIIRLGRFTTWDEALEARIAAQRQYFGEMSPV